MTRLPRPEWRTVALVAYAGLLLYGSLFPLSRWETPEAGFWRLFFQPGRISRTDLLANFLIYVPLGWLVARSTGAASSRRAFCVATAMGALLSFGAEYAQASLPNRVSSVYDWALNVAGSALGAFAAASAASRRSKLTFDRVLAPSIITRVGALAVLLWTMSQLFPFVPSVDVGNLRSGLGPVARVVRGTAPFSHFQTSAYAFALFALCVVLHATLRPRLRRGAIVVLFFTAVLVAKIPVLGQTLSLEAIGGAAVAFLAYGFLQQLPARTVLAGVSVVGSVVAESLRAGRSGVLSEMNWIPFRLHLTNELIGIAQILEAIWPWVALAFLIVRANPRHPQRIAAAGTASAFSIVLALEWAQQSIPGRSPDATDAILAAGAFLLPWLHPSVRRALSQESTSG